MKNNTYNPVKFSHVYTVYNVFRESQNVKVDSYGAKADIHRDYDQIVEASSFDVLEVAHIKHVRTFCYEAHFAPSLSFEGSNFEGTKPEHDSTPKQRIS